MEQNINAQNLPDQQDLSVVSVKKREYSGIESAFALVCLLAGYAFCRVFPVSQNAFGGLLFVIALFGVTAVVLVKKGARSGLMPTLAFVSSVAVSFGLFVSSNSFIHWLSYIYSVASYCYFVYASFGNALEKGFSNLIAADFFKALFVLPFASFAEIFSALASGKGKERGRLVLKIVIGAAIALVPTVIICLLLSYDKGFTELLSKIFKFDFWDVVSHIFSIGFGIPVAMYLYGAFISSADNKQMETITAENCRSVCKKVRVMPSVTAVVAVLPIIFLYVVFFISQWKYYVSGFVGVLPDSVSYAEYAREGFFQLCSVSVINLVIISAISLFMRRSENGRSVILKVLSIVFSVFTLVLISTAMAKMVLYINRYGLTPKRVYSSWFMVVIALVFLFIIIKQFAPKLKLVALSLAASVVMFSVLALSGTDSLIARYNADRYLNKTLESVDVSAMESLGDSAIPSLVRIATELNKEKDVSVSKQVENSERKLYTFMIDDYIYEGYYDVTDQHREVFDALARYVHQKDDDNVFSLTLPQILADRALKGADIEKSLK
ncbi:MAG: DUF4173 domain-containing protein [Ruminococcaceae bacterium]|nr:DUF4173 domain-containing protein [Oscillospiraceae bacterium]